MDTDARKEYNLFDLIAIFFRWCGRMLGRLWILCGQALRLSYRKLWIVLIGAVVGAAAGYYMSRPSARYYKAEATAIVNGPSSLTIRQALAGVMKATPVEVSPIHTLACKLQLPDSIAASIRQISAYPVVDCLNDGTPDYVDYDFKAKLSDTLNIVSNKFVQLLVVTRRPDLLPDFEKALLRYLNTIPAVEESYRMYCKTAGELYESVSHQVEYLDSLSRRLYVEEPVERTINMERGRILVGDGVRMVSTDLTREREQLLYASRMADNMTAPILLVDHFSVSAVPVNSRGKYCLIGLLAGYLIALLIAALVERRKDITAFLRS